MPRTRSLAWAELKIGLLSLAALALAALLIFALSGTGGFGWQVYSLKTVFANISGLNQGAQVRMAGVPIGTVTGIAFVGERVEVTFEISEEMQSRVTTESRATLGSVSLLGESAVDITPSTKGTPIPEWGYVPPGDIAGSIADVTAQATEGIQEVTALLQDIRAGRGTLGQLATNDQLYRELNGLLVSVSQVTQGISQGRGTLGRLMTNDATARSLEASLANLESMMARIRAGEGSIGKLMTDDTLSRNLTSMSANADQLTAKLNNGEGTMGQLMTNRQLFDRFNAVAGRLEQVTTGLNDGEGTAGQLLRDKRLYENMNETMNQMRQLVADIRADPKKYLNVRVSLF